MVLDSVLADDCRGDSDGNRVACEVPEGTSFIVDSAVWLAFLGGLRGSRLASDVVRDHVHRASYPKEYVIGKLVSENIARPQHRRRDQVVPERRLFASRQARDVLGRVPAFLSARPGIDCGLAQQGLGLADDDSGIVVCSARLCVLAVG